MKRLAHWFILMLKTSNGRQKEAGGYLLESKCLAANVCMGVLLAAVFFLNRYFAATCFPLTVVSGGLETSRLRFPFRKFDHQRTIGAAIKIEE
jgi:hypothetical protein